MKKTKPGPVAVEQIKLAELIPQARNARTHSDEQVAQIAASIREFGFTNPVLIDAQGTIIAGHGRVMAARKLGLESVPCLRLGHLTPEQVRAYVIADNKLALNAGWDDEMLKAELDALLKGGFDVGLAGFSDAELQEMLSAAPQPIDDGEPNQAEAENKWQVREGDIWTLGRHRIACGDSSDRRVVSALLGEDEPACAIVDPPYELKESVWSKWIMDPCIVFGQAKHIRMIPDRLWRFERVVVKRHKHRSATVQVRHAHAFIAQCGTQKKLPEDKKATFPSVIEQEVETEHDHQKPAFLIAEHLQAWTPKGNGIVLDPFSGSGSTILACESIGWTARAIELSPGYVSVAIERWAAATGGAPHKG